MIWERSDVSIIFIFNLFGICILKIMKRILFLFLTYQTPVVFIAAGKSYYTIVREFSCGVSLCMASQNRVCRHRLKSSSKQSGHNAITKAFPHPWQLVGFPVKKCTWHIFLLSRSSMTPATFLYHSLGLCKTLENQTGYRRHPACFCT